MPKAILEDGTILSLLGLPIGSVDQTLRHNGTNWIASAFMLNTGTRIGIGTSSPQKPLDLVGTERISFSTTSNDFTDITQITRADFYGGLAIEPAANSSGLKWIHLFGQSESTALSLLDDGAGYWFRTSLPRDMNFNINNGQSYGFGSNFDAVLVMQGPSGTTGAANFKVPTDYTLRDTNTTTLQTGYFRISHTISSGTPAAGLGVGMGFDLSDSALNRDRAANFDCAWDTATAGSEDSYLRFQVVDAGTMKEIVRFEGKTPQVIFHNNASGTPQASFDVSNGKAYIKGEIEIDGALNHDGTTVGFYATAPATQQTATGSRGGNAALASLLTALAASGLIVDSTTA